MNQEDEFIFCEDEFSDDEEEYSDNEVDIFASESDNSDTDSSSAHEDEIGSFPSKRPRRISSTSTSDQYHCPACEEPHNVACEGDLDTWTTDESDPLHFKFRGNPGLMIADDAKSPGDFFDLFLTDSFLNQIVEDTNRYASQEIAKSQLLRSSRLRTWKDTNVKELRLFFGLLMHTGTISLPTLEHYWKKSDFYKLNFWKKRMARNRFQILLRMIHFSNNEETSDDRLSKVSAISQHFNETMDSIYKPGKRLCIDEAIVLWRRRLVFRQYVKNKRHRYGIKLYELCEPNGIVLRVKIYAGKNDELSGRGHVSNVVSSLMDGFLHSGHELYMDNYYNSVGVTKDLTSKSTCVCGTLRLDRKGNPEQLVKKKLKAGDSEWLRSGPIIVNKWRDKRDVLTISNMHKGEMVPVTNKNGKMSYKPDMVRDYTLGMPGVDRADQRMSYYTFLRKTIRWYKKIALHYLEIFLQNAYMFYNNKNQGGKKMRMLQFRESVIHHLLNDDGSNAEQPECNQCNQNQGDFHYLEHLPPTEKKTMPTKPCRMCTKSQKRKETRYFCPVCPENPALCVTPCFIDHHVKSNH